MKIMGSFWNSLDLNLPINHIKSKIKSYFWQHFIRNFNPDNIHNLRFIFVLVDTVFIILQAIIITCNINIHIFNSVVIVIIK